MAGEGGNISTPSSASNDSAGMFLASNRSNGARAPSRKVHAFAMGVSN